MAELDNRFNPAEIEDRWYAWWNERGFFKADAESDAKPYTIVIPPPNVTGVLHVGHGLNNTLQDILVRWKRMQGCNTLWLPGTDHASIATETKITEKLAAEGIDKREYGREKFVEAAWEWTREYGGAIIQQLKRMGCSCDWSRQRFTMDEQLSRAVRVAFKRLYDRGLIYRGKYLVNWCPTCRTVLSNDEVEHQEKQGRLWHINYPLKNGGQLTVATTRPETMLGDTAVAVNPDDERNKQLVGQTCLLPLMDREIPIIADPFVDPEFGTGCVKVTPGHDPNDFAMGRRHNLEQINILNDDGTLNENAGPYEGLDRFVARKKVVADLDQLGLLEKIEDYTNAVGHHDRCGEIIEPYLSDQWFVKMEPLAKPALEAVRDGRTKFASMQYENTYYHWMENVRDWPISRQLYWGHRIPIWYRKDDRSQMICFDGEGLPPEVAAEPDAWEQDPDILDTWFSSALWPFSTLGWPDETPDLKTFYPTDVLITAHEILFFWVARMIMMGLECMGKVPFADVYIHAMIFDLKTRSKMSKSLGNVIDPLDMIDKYGADAMRYTFCAYAIQGRNIYLDEQRFEGYRNFMNKLWNAARFVMMNTEDLTPDEFAAGIDEAALPLEDRWILSRLRDTVAAVDRRLNAFAFDALGQDIYHFVWDDYCDWCVELAKPRLNSTDDADARKSAQKVVLCVLETLLRLMHPIAPFLTEEIWQKLKALAGGAQANSPASPAIAASCRALAAESIMIAPFPKAEDIPADAEAETAFSRVQEIITAIRRIRAGINIPPKDATDIFLISADAADREFLAGHAHYLSACVPTGEIHVAATPEGLPRALTETLGATTVALPISEEIRQRELERLGKDVAKLEKGVKGASGKLANENFIANAKPDVIEKERKRLADLQADLARAQAKLTALK